MKEYMHYIFDFDMTLFDTLPGMEQCYKAAFESICTEYDKDELSLFLGEDLKSTYNRYKTDFSDFGNFERAFLRTSETLMCLNTEVYRDTCETIVQLFQCGKTLSIATGKPKDRVLEILKKYRLENYFSYICGYGQYSEPKPSPESIEKCINQTSIAKCDTVYIGDSDNDLIAATKAGIDSYQINRDVNGNDTNFTINSLAELLRDFEICMFTVMTTKYDVLANENSDELLQTYCQKERYQLNHNNKLQCCINIDELRDMYINRYGTIIISERFKCKGLLADDILAYKERINKDNLYNDQTAVQNIFHNYNEWAQCVAKEQFNKESKVSYTLVSYLCRVYVASALDFCSNTVKEVFLLLTKNHTHFEKEDEAKCLVELFGGQCVPFVQINDKNFFAAMWGSRVLITTDENEVVFEEYIEEERVTQNLWMLLSANNKIIDNEEWKLEPHDLVNALYEVLSYESNIKYINALRKHRYQIEISQLLFNISNLNIIEKYFNEKVEMLERRISLEASKREKESDYKMNISLFVLTVISGVSAIFQVVNYWNDAPENNWQSVAWSILTLVVIILFFGVRFLVKRLYMTGTMSKHKSRQKGRIDKKKHKKSTKKEQKQTTN